MSKLIEGICPKCYEWTCHCGHKYRNLNVSDRLFFASAVLGVQVHAIAEQLSGIIPNRHPLGDPEKFIPEEELELG